MSEINQILRVIPNSVQGLIFNNEMLNQSAGGQHGVNTKDMI